MVMTDPGTTRWQRWRRAAWDALRALPHGDRKQRMIYGGLTAAHERAGEPQRFELHGDKLVIFSDHHRGDGTNDADDFRRCERAYRAALAYYYEQGHTLALLGDVEELWENRLAKAFKCYGEVLALESRFHERGRLWRFYGNHDLVWSSPKQVARHLAERIGGEAVAVKESLKLDVYDGERRLGQLFLTHGHQGTPSSDLFAPVAMIPVRFIWPKVQRGVKFASTTPARDFKLREHHDLAMLTWAKEDLNDRASHEPPAVLIAGHTHKPVFFERTAELGVTGGDDVPELPSVADAEAAYEAAVSDKDVSVDERARRHALLQFVSTRDFGSPPIDVDPPCYFNSGCCSYGDGDVTGIEISGGKIRLVRWLNNDGKPELHVLSKAEPLDGVFDKVRAATGKR
jgi:UDP-2,3-diacylglucosamine pyrophosphatase LpxH